MIIGVATKRLFKNEIQTELENLGFLTAMAVGLQP